jgi:hypothetical protein
MRLQVGHINRTTEIGMPEEDRQQALLPLHSAVVLLASLQTSEAAAGLTIAAGQNVPCAVLAGASAFVTSVPFFRRLVARHS